MWYTFCGTFWRSRCPNLVFLLLFCFVLLVLLILSVAVSDYADRLKRLTQENAMLEKRVRELEHRLDGRDC